MEGKAFPVSDKKKIDEISKMLNIKFPTMTHLVAQPESIVIKIMPKACYFMDYAKGFSYRDQVKY
jgi:hypothetical protein